MAREAQVMSRKFLFDDADVHEGVRLEFGNGKVLEVLFSELSPTVLAHATANGLGEAFRDIGAGKTADEAYAGAVQRKAAMVGPDGVYAARGGAALNWVEDIMAAAMILDPGMTPEIIDARRASIEGKSVAEHKEWLKARPPLQNAVTAIRDARKAARSNAKAKAKAGNGLNW